MARRSGGISAVALAVLAAAGCAAPPWRCAEPGLPASWGDARACWQRLVADATEDERNGGIAQLVDRAAEARENPTWGTFPVMHLAVAGGVLVGLDLGEWGGSLWWVAADGSSHRRLARGNVKTLLAGPREVLVVTGLRHLTSDEGRLLHLDPAGWQVTRTTALPGDAEAVFLVPAGDPLFVARGQLLAWDGERLSVPVAGVPLSGRSLLR